MIEMVTAMIVAIHNAAISPISTDVSGFPTILTQLNVG
jgi:hypothetical protein